MGDGYKISKNATSACWITYIAAIIVIIAFATPYWLENDGLSQPAQFVKLGLWEACLDNFQEINHLYDRRYTGCRWIFDEDYHLIKDILLPPFFVAVQFFFTLCFLIMLISCVAVIVLTLCVPQEKEIMGLLVIWIMLLVSGICGTLSVIIFGAKGDSQHWMPKYEHNYLSWSFGLAVVGTFLVYVASTLFFVEWRVQKRRLKKQQRTAVGGHARY